MRDLHIHTEFSCDSEARIGEYVARAIEKNLETICFTDHVDLNINDYGYNYYKADSFFEKYNDLKVKHQNQLEILAGIEFGEPHLYPHQLQQLSKYNYDFIIGSIHWIGDMFPCQKVREKYSAKEFFIMYWDVMLDTVKQDGFDALGHIDFPKRYYNEIYYSEDIVSEIFKHLIENDSVIEINTSSLRKGCEETMPGNELLNIYKSVGGKYITIGSDAHVIGDLNAGYEMATSLIKKMGLKEVKYVNRKRICFEVH